MKYDVVILGGGLSALTAGITLAKQGKRTCIVAAGQSSLHTSSGSFDLLGYNENGHLIENPIEAIDELKDNHPYKKIGKKNVEKQAKRAKLLLEEAGIQMYGNANKNHFRISPLGLLKATWLTLKDYVIAENINIDWKEVSIINLKGFLDFPYKFIQENLKLKGIKANIIDITTPELEFLRKNPTEMRATNVAKALNSNEALDNLINQINRANIKTDVILFPSVIGFFDNKGIEKLKQKCNKKIKFVATMPPSVSGVRVTAQLKKYFTSLGGTILVGDKAVSGNIENNKVISIRTSQLPEDDIFAKHFIIATGSFMSHGLESNYNKVYEPILDLDVDAFEDRRQWTKENVFEIQEYMKFGVKTDNTLHTFKNGKIIENLYAIGSILSNTDRIKSASAEGISMLTALQVAENILGEK